MAQAQGKLFRHKSSGRNTTLGSSSRAASPRPLLLSTQPPVIKASPAEESVLWGGLSYHRGTALQRAAMQSVRSSGRIANHSRMSRKRPVVVCNVPLAIGQAIDLSAVPQRDRLEAPVLASQEVFQVV